MESLKDISFHPLWNVRIAATDYDGAVNAVFRSVEERTPVTASALAVHGLTESVLDPEFAQTLAGFDLLVPDGQPLRHSLNWIWNAGLKDRVYGPEWMLRLCARAQKENCPVFLYGSTREVVQKLKENLLHRYPDLKVVGSEPSQFRDLSEKEIQRLAQQIEAAQTDLVFLGLGCPRQEKFAARLRPYTRAALICTGAAFDFISGTKRMAPRWMQTYSLEWLFRLASEPARLWRRYLWRNSYFLWLMFKHFSGIKNARGEVK